MALFEAKTKYGLVRGHSMEGYTVFKGIPYAKPPLGEGRFAAPQEPDSWEGIYEAEHFGSVAMQVPLDPASFYGKEFYQYPDYMPARSEDCLYLNIWTPAGEAGEKLPVAFWIHGGAFLQGYSHEVEFDGEAYCRRDVEAEMQIQQRLSKFPVPDSVWEEYWQDQEINDRGIGVDMEMVAQAIAIDGRSKSELSAAMKELTELENPNSVQQMKQWLSENGMETDSLDKKAVSELLKTAPEPLGEVLSLRQQLARSSVKKYQAMQNAVCADGRAHGMFQFYGANRTGRYSGRIIQLQNLPQNHIPDLAQARELVKAGDFDALAMLYEDIPDTLSQLIRTAFVPQGGRKFIVADFSAIEARVIAWIAGERWRLKVFEGGGDIYCASASQMFHVPVEKHGVNGHLRQKGKIAELALGYGGSVGALKSMGALEMGLAEEELPPLVSAWRDSNPSITEFWWAVDRTVKECVKKRMPTETHGIRFDYQSGMLFITLFSGRRLAYVKPRIGENQFGGESVTYMGVGGTKKWERLESYGPKFVENIVQAVSRDILCYAMQTLRNCSIVAHVHDEIIIEANRRMSLPAVCEQMGRTPPWAKGLLLRADGYECSFYKKD